MKPTIEGSSEPVRIDRRTAVKGGFAAAFGTIFLSPRRSEAAPILERYADVVDLVGPGNFQQSVIQAEGAANVPNTRIGQGLWANSSSEGFSTTNPIQTGQQFWFEGEKGELKGDYKIIGGEATPQGNVTQLELRNGELPGYGANVWTGLNAAINPRTGKKCLVLSQDIAGTVYDDSGAETSESFTPRNMTVTVTTVDGKVMSRSFVNDGKNPLPNNLLIPLGFGQEQGTNLANVIPGVQDFKQIQDISLTFSEQENLADAASNSGKTRSLTFNYGRQNRNI